jgi:hypothetical protein
LALRQSMRVVPREIALSSLEGMGAFSIFDFRFWIAD